MRIGAPDFNVKCFQIIFCCDELRFPLLLFLGRYAFFQKVFLNNRNVRQQRVFSFALFRSELVRQSLSSYRERIQKRAGSAPLSHLESVGVPA